MKPTVVIVGANLAGGRAAETLRAEGFEGRIVLIGEESRRPYERPPMSKEVLRGEWPPERAFLRSEEWYAENDVELMLGVRATMVDTAEQTVVAGGALVPYDALLFATGGTPRELPIPGADLPGVHALRTMDDAAAIGASLQQGARAFIVGAGFIGCEVAASARSMGCEVTVADIFGVPLERALGPEIGAVYGSIHRERGVGLRMNAEVERIEGAGRVERVVLGDGTAFDTDVVVMGVGIIPNDELAREAGIACGNGILVDEHCMTSTRGVFAAGDVAEHPNPILGARIRVEHWQNAQNQGAAAARAILGKPEPFAEVPWFWSDQYDVNLQVAGHPVTWDRIVYRGSVAERNFTAFYLDGARIAAVAGLNRGKEVRAGRALIQAGARIDDSVLADDGTDMRALAKAATA